jgi:hypothetical protein
MKHAREFSAVALVRKPASATTLGVAPPEAKVSSRRPDGTAAIGIQHRIDLKPHPTRYDGAEMFYQCRRIGLSRHGALFEAARWLLKEGIAQPADMVGTYRGDMLCTYGMAGELAKWSVSESDTHGLRYVRYKPFTLAAMKLRVPT